MEELVGLKILVVEDEPLVAMALEDLLIDFGCVVIGPVRDLEKAMRLIGEETIDGAILDVNLGGHQVFPLADILAQRAIPFVYVTGYGPSVLRQCNHSRPVLQKPYAVAELIRIVSQWCRE